jgi:hypothetical protein
MMYFINIIVVDILFKIFDQSLKTLIFNLVYTSPPPKRGSPGKWHACFVSHRTAAAPVACRRSLRLYRTSAIVVAPLPRYTHPLDLFGVDLDFGLVDFRS